MRFTATTTRVIKAAGRRLGVEISHYRPPELRRASIMDRYGIELVLDVGANRGQYATSLRRNGYKGQIMSFEPGTEPFGLLKSLSASDATWHAYPVALGGQDGTALLRVGRSDATSSLLAVESRHISAAAQSSQHRSESVSIAKLDTVLAAQPSRHHIGARTYLKMDVQGSELGVLAGASETLKQVLLIECEMSVVGLYTDQPLITEVMTTLAALGFDLIALEPGFYDRSTGEYLQFDGVFVKRCSK